MAHIATATLQPAADCRWFRSWADFGVPEGRRTDSCVCVREGTARDVSPAFCETCPHWEPAGGGAVAATAIAIPTFAVPRIRPPAFLRALTRTVFALVALLLVALGIMMLTSPWIIPMSVVLWLSGAALGSYGVFGPMPEG
jgi:hypothetical protein